MLNRMTSKLQRQFQLLMVAIGAGHKAVDDDAKLYQCAKCHKSCDDWEGSNCETCGEFFCDSCLVTDEQPMAPECCHACADESMAETYRTLGRPD